MCSRQRLRCDGTYTRDAQGESSWLRRHVRGLSSESSHQWPQVGRTAGGRRTKKRAGKKQPPPRYPILTLSSKESGEGHLQRSQDLPYCTFALLTHEFFAGLASASHFSIATLYSASRLSAFASLRTSACFVAASWRVSAATRSTLASALPLTSPAFASFTQTSFWLPARSSHFAIATS